MDFLVEVFSNGCLVATFKAKSLQEALERLNGYHTLDNPKADIVQLPSKTY